MDTPRHVLLLMRHGKAASPEGVPDHERPLAPRGRRDAAAAGEWLSSAGLVPDVVLFSDAVRASDTARRAVDGLVGDGQRPVEQASADLYQAGIDRVLHAVSGTPEEVGTLLVVGHEPTTSATVRAVTGRDVSMPTAAVAVVELGCAWHEVTADAGRLRSVHTPDR